MGQTRLYAGASFQRSLPVTQAMSLGGEPSTSGSRLRGWSRSSTTLSRSARHARGGHMLAYFIPGDEAAYRARASSDQLGLVYRGGRAGACPLSDRQGRVPASCLAGPGLASAALIGEICDVAEREVHPIFAELVATT